MVPPSKIGPASMANVWLVPDGLDGQRLDAAAARMTGLSRSRVAGFGRGGQGSTQLRAGHEIAPRSYR